jgi:hypothetical protein
MLGLGIADGEGLGVGAPAGADVALELHAETRIETAATTGMSRSSGRRRPMAGGVERETGLEPATFSLEGRNV